MVGGLDKFREAFAAFTNNFVIIGGTACDEVLGGTIMRPRPTLDIDIIVIVENMTADFASAFWQFIADGGYRPGVRKKEDGSPRYVLYSFDNGVEGYPVKIELLSRRNELFANAAHTEPLPINGDVSSLSAIILDEPYYHLTISNSFVSNGLRYAAPVALAALKARAYLNLLAERESGHRVNSKDIFKHRNDVLKLAATMTPGDTVDAHQEVIDTITEFSDTLFASLPNQSLSDALRANDNTLRLYLETLPTFYVAEG
jgi:hypothetical protein